MEAHLVEIDGGWDFKVLVVDGEWVLRVPRVADAAEKLEREAALLAALAPALPVAVPQFEQLSNRPPFAVYRLIRGEPLRNQDPEGVRGFLDALHSFDASTVPGVRRPDWLEAWHANAEIFRALVLPRLDLDERARGESLLREVGTLTGFEPALTHCDLGPEHLLVRRDRLVGVIDWAGAEIGDPALDYAWLLNVPFPDWDVDEDLRRRARIYHRLGPWFEVEYGVRTRQPAFVESGLAGVRSRL
ncbi:MAG TPA: phosphotransferase [Gaiellaceae bacterium]|nr:phosphotransferase [Gaiellaceae bacterium]